VLVATKERNGGGGQVVLASTEPGANFGRPEREVVPVLESGEVCLFVSPDESRIAYTIGGTQLGFHHHLCIWNTASGSSEPIEQASIVAFFWSPDSRWCASCPHSIIDALYLLSLCVGR
jgi:hypothetical protein